MKISVRKLGILSAAVMLSSVSLAWAEVKVATVDMQRAIQSVAKGRKAKEQLEKEFNAKKKELQAEEASIKKMGEEFKKQSLVMSDEARAKKQGELQERIMKFQELTARSQVEIQNKERDLTQPIVAKLRVIIAEMAKKKSYSLILEKNENTVLFSEDKDDLTDEVIHSFDQQTKS